MLLSLLALWSVQQSQGRITELTNFRDEPADYLEVTFGDNRPADKFHEVTLCPSVFKHQAVRTPVRCPNVRRADCRRLKGCTSFMTAIVTAEYTTPEITAM